MVKDLTDQEFHRLTARRRTTNSNAGKARWECDCVCGNTCVVVGSGLISGNSKSCGCLMREATGARRRTHGLSKTPMYEAWLKTVERCTKPTNRDYAFYGGRGITVCERWLTYENYLADMGDRPQGMTLDRIDNNGPYSPENCRWATRKEQANNTRSNRHITYNNETLSISQWAVRLGWSEGVLRSRLDRGWSHEQAITTPHRYGTPRHNRSS